MGFPRPTIQLLRSRTARVRRNADPIQPSSVIIIQTTPQSSSFPIFPLVLVMAPSPAPAAVVTGESLVPTPSRRGLPPPCWSNDETLALIEIYRDKWHSLRCGNLRAADWEAVATDVNRRCSHLPSANPKTSVQCRHKVEKLRKRFRSEQLRSHTLRPTWPFFHIMESLDHPPHSTSDSGAARNTRSHHGQMPNGGEGLRFTIPKALRSKVVNPSSGSGPIMKRSMEEMRPRLESKKLKRRERDEVAVRDVVSTLRMIGDGLIRMERMKMDMARETKKFRMDIELKRTEMMLDFQSQLVDSFVKRFDGKVNKKAKVSSDA